MHNPLLVKNAPGRDLDASGHFRGDDPGASLIAAGLSLWRRARSGAVSLALLGGLAVLCASCSALSSRAVSDPAPSAARLRAGGSVRAEVDRLAQPLIDSGEACGLIVSVVRQDGQAQTFGYGLTGRPGDLQPPDGDTVFQIGSVSKLFVDALLIKLIDEGQMSYQDTVRSILPAAVPLSKDAGDLTIYDLVSNTGGLPRQPNNVRQMRYFMNFLFTGHNLYGCIDKDYLYEYLRTCRLPPKSQRSYAYSNIGIGLLTHLIELKTGRSISDLLDEKICRPLNLRDTVLRLDDGQARRLAVGHPGNQPKFMSRKTPLPPWDMGEILGGSCGLYSTANDLAVFARANLGQLRHPIEPVLISMHNVIVKTPSENVAVGWSVDYFDHGRTVITYKHGMVSGYSAYIGVNTEQKIGVVVICNNFNWSDKVGHNLIVRLSEACAPVPASDRSNSAVNQLNTPAVRQYSSSAAPEQSPP